MAALLGSPLSPLSPFSPWDREVREVRRFQARLDGRLGRWALGAQAHLAARQNLEGRFALRPGGTDGACRPGLALRSGGTGIALRALQLATSVQ